MIKIIEESKPCKVPPPSVILNSPVAPDGIYLLPDVEEISARDLEALKKARVIWYWSEDDLDDLDMFFLTPGWRISGRGLEMLRAAGYDLQIDTIEAQLARVRTAEAVKRWKEDLRAEAKRRYLEAEWVAYQEWRSEVTRGLVETTVAPWFYVNSPDAVRDGEWTIVRGVRFRLLKCWSSRVGWYTTGDLWYEAVMPDGTRVLACFYGSAAKFYVDPETAHRYYRERWERDVAEHGEAEMASRALHYLEHYSMCYGADYWLWIASTFGLDKLAAMAQKVDC